MRTFATLGVLVSKLFAVATVLLDRPDVHLSDGDGRKQGGWCEVGAKGGVSRVRSEPGGRGISSSFFRLQALSENNPLPPRKAT